MESVKLDLSPSSKRVQGGRQSFAFTSAPNHQGSLRLQFKDARTGQGKVCQCPFGPQSGTKRSWAAARGSGAALVSQARASLLRASLGSMQCPMARMRSRRSPAHSRTFSQSQFSGSPNTSQLRYPRWCPAASAIWISPGFQLRESRTLWTAISPATGGTSTGIRSGRLKGLFFRRSRTGIHSGSPRRQPEIRQIQTVLLAPYMYGRRAEFAWPPGTILPASGFPGLWSQHVMYSSRVVAKFLPPVVALIADTSSGAGP